MNLFSPFLRLFGVGALGNADTGPQVGASSGITTDTGISVNDERALAVSTVWACLQLITNSVASLPLEFFRRTPDGRTKITGHYLNDLFQMSPNSLMKPRDFRKTMTFQLANWSNAYAEITWSGTSPNARPIALTPLRPGRMTPTIDDDGKLVYWYQTSNGVIVYAKKSIMHLKGFSAEGIVGLERNQYSRQTMGVTVSADMFAAKQFANGGRSGGGYLTMDAWLNEKQRKQIKELTSGMSETAANAGKVWALEGGLKYEPDRINPDTMQMIETRRMQIGEIARFYGVPEVMLGGGGATSAWPASFEQQILSFLTFTLQDYLDEWEHTIRDSLLVGRDRREIFADHDTTGFVKMDSPAKAQLQSTWVQNGLKTRNEIRKINNDPPVDGGDDLTVQVNLTPVDALPRATNDTQTPTA